MLQKVTLSFFGFLLLGYALLVSSFNTQDEAFKNEIFVEGQVFYDLDNPRYRDLRVSGKIYEDGKFYRAFSCDAKGKFSTSVGINHDYVFHFSMDYHGTTKVLVSTKMPEENRKKQIGGLFKFKCELFERVEGLSMVILKKPIIKIRYLPKKDKFEPDKAYTEAFLLELESFRETLAILKSRNKQVLKNAAEAKAKQQAVAQKTPPPPKKQEKKPKPNPNPRGHRNILDNLKADPVENEESAEVATETEEDENEDVAPVSEPVNTDENIAQTDTAKIEEPTPQMTAIASVKVVPKRIKIEESDLGALTRKVIVQKQAAVVREQKMEQLRTNVQQTIARNTLSEQQVLSNKQIQSIRLQGIIKTVATKETYTKKAHFNQQPVPDKNLVLPIVRTVLDEGWFKDVKQIHVIYPTERIAYRMESYLFGIQYYYKNNSEISEAAFCEEIARYEKINELCVN
jgi:hypothetical protein